MCRLLSFQTFAEIVGKTSYVPVIWDHARELFGIFQGGTDFPGIAAKRYKGQQGLAIVRMPGKVLFQDLHRFVDAAGRMQ